MWGSSRPQQLSICIEWGEICKGAAWEKGRGSGSSSFRMQMSTEGAERERERERERRHLIEATAAAASAVPAHSCCLVGERARGGTLQKG
jgi:hypothetical protein